MNDERNIVADLLHDAWQISWRFAAAAEKVSASSGELERRSGYHSEHKAGSRPSDWISMVGSTFLLRSWILITQMKLFALLEQPFHDGDTVICVVEGPHMVGSTVQTADCSASHAG